MFHLKFVPGNVNGAWHNFGSYSLIYKIIRVCVCVWGGGVQKVWFVV